MLKEAINDDNPVLCFLDRSIFYREEEILPKKENYIGRANVVKKGDDLTIIAISSCLYMIEDILPEIEKNNISAEIINVRSIVPLDFETIKKSVQKTGRVLICDTANKTSSSASEISSLIAEKSEILPHSLSKEPSFIPLIEQYSPSSIDSIASRTHLLFARSLALPSERRLPLVIMERSMPASSTRSIVSSIWG